ncbi:hypothetical protein ESCO_001430 [Escovopsis weberi]|uniref:Uncharacterized protein n=1 Tax=Escovopsis weberi TaxID=150374 RepID=A0A0M8N7G4_ESCWE|nr:hypothetical protein ESCO_001430 [Escovopsis weberi]
MTNFPCCRIPLEVSSSPNNLTYVESMYHLIEIISRRLDPDSIANATSKQIFENCQAVEDLRKKLRPHMQDKNQCKSAVDRLQYFAVRLHTSFVISVACRPALRRDVAIDPVEKQTLAQKCKNHLIETVRMFLAMHQLSVIPTRSWAFTYHGLSSALLLGIIADTKADPEIRQLEGDLIAALSATAAKDVDSPETHVMRTDKDIELSGPLSRALTALKHIYENGSLSVPNRKRKMEGQRTPFPPLSPNGGQISVPLLPGQFNGIPASQSAPDPREDAALAMAEMQNGTSIQDMSRRPESMQMQPNMGMDNLGLGVDMQYMAPMDVFDSIWVGTFDTLHLLFEMGRLTNMF